MFACHRLRQWPPRLTHEISQACPSTRHAMSVRDPGWTLTGGTCQKHLTSDLYEHLHWIGTVQMCGLHNKPSSAKTCVESVSFEEIDNDDTFRRTSKIVDSRGSTRNSKSSQRANKVVHATLCLYSWLLFVAACVCVRVGRKPQPVKMRMPVVPLKPPRARWASRDREDILSNWDLVSKVGVLRFHFCRPEMRALHDWRLKLEHTSNEAA